FQSLAEKFKPKPGSWNCDTCLVSNPPGTVKCLACATPKPGVVPTTQATTSTPSQPQPASATGGFRFRGTISSPQTSGFTFGGSDSDKPSQNSGFTFGQAFGGSQPQITSGFSFGSSKPTGGFSFGSESTKLASSTQQKPSSPTAVATTTNDADKKDKTTSLSEMFKPKAGVWSCPTCLCQNTAEHKKCPACQTHQPGAQPEASSSFASSTTSSSFKLGNTSLEQLLGKSDSNGQPSTTAPTKVYATSPAPAKTFSFGQSGKSLPQFTFGGGDVSGAVSSPPASTGYTFGAPKPTSVGFVFGSNLNQNAAEEQALDLSSPKKTPDQGCKFSEMAKSFTFQFKMDPEEAANA
ncbi:nuclear pore complex protein Nup153-like, partial [Anneissia japonica]|uniref:nuclear pore complex protein Nup153-like n=1 Tax=Anneissia japonica TaxID=1529436 RepID=UPI0014256BE3